MSASEKVSLGRQIYRGAQGKYTKTQIAKSLGFARGGFYYQSRLEKKDKEVVNQIEEWHREDNTLGHKKIGPLVGVGKNRAKRIMRKYGIEARRAKKKYKHPGASHKKHPNLANDQEEAEKYDDVIFSDIFEFKLADRSIVRGCFALRKSTRQVLGLVFSYGMVAELVVETVNEVGKIKDGTYIWHSDQGKQYGAEKTEAMVRKLGMEPSMSRAGTPTDNPFAERFVGVFKLSVVKRRKYATLGEFLTAAEKWINFYNNLRPHEGIGQKSPNDRAAEIGVEKVLLLRPNCV